MTETGVELTATESVVTHIYPVTLALAILGLALIRGTIAIENIIDCVVEI